MPTNLWPMLPVNLRGDVAASFVAQRQHGLITSRQAIAAGLTRRRIDVHRERGRWLSVAPGVWAVGAAPTTAAGELAAALLWAGPDAGAAGTSAARLWSLERSSGPVEIVVGRSRRPRRPGVIVRRSRQLDPHGDLTRRHGFPVTTLLRTLLDACAHRSPETATDLVDEAIRLGHTSAAALLTRASALPSRGRPEVACLIELARELETRTDSAFERRTLDLVRRFGLPEPECQVPFTWDGRALRADFAWPAARVVLECDGFAYHRRRRDLARDRWRRRAFGALGQQVVEITWDDVRDAAAFAPVAADLAHRLGVSPPRGARRTGGPTRGGGGRG